MTDFVQHHSLNNSTSKQKFSFPKTDRFKNEFKVACQSLYQVPSTRSSRATSFGYGQKDMGIQLKKSMPPVGAYQLGTQFPKDDKKGYSFGVGRQEMALGGPLKDTKLMSFIPGPGRYDSNKSMLDRQASSMRKKLPDRSIDHLVKNPGPGAYAFQEIGTNMYYASSKYRNNTNLKISPGSRLASIGRRATIEVGPGSYSINIQDLNPQGKYHLSKNQNSKTRTFNKSQRQGLVSKHMLNTPSPNQYKLFSSFG